MQLAPFRATRPHVAVLLAAMTIFFAGCTSAPGDVARNDRAPEGFHLCEAGASMMAGGVTQNPWEYTQEQRNEMTPVPEAARLKLLAQEPDQDCDQISGGVAVAWYQYASEADHDSAVRQLKVEGCGTGDVLTRGTEVVVVGSDEDSAAAERVIDAVLAHDQSWQSAC